MQINILKFIHYPMQNTNEGKNVVMENMPTPKTTHFLSVIKKSPKQIP